jgi:ComF family protein
MASSTVRLVVDFVLPPRCSGCGAIISDPHSFCPACWGSLSMLGDPCCARCGLPFDYFAGEEVECGRCLADPPHFDRLRAAVAYGNVARQVALKLKYSGRPGVAVTLGRLMARHLPSSESGYILVPVPLHRWRIWRRGYNQSALIASSLARGSGLRVDLDLLRRIKPTPVLRGLGRRERALAVRGAFAVRDKASVEGRSFILVDDIFTSGATANACAGVMKRAGAERVEILCWARVVIEQPG